MTGLDRFVERARVDVDRLGRLADQHRKGMHGLAQLLQQRRQGGIQQRHRRRLLRDIEPGGGAGGLLGLESSENLFAVFQILLRHLNAVAQLERLEIRRRDAADHRERDGLLIVAAGGRGRARGVAQRPVLAPEIQLVACAQSGTEDIEHPRTRA